jgi:ectoine hydroxylase-related dioxygenase (phytanoyl-CoA dioxygenase family)
MEAFRRSGFLVARGLFTEGEADELRAFADELANAVPHGVGSHRPYLDDDARDRGAEILSRIEYFRASHAGLRSALEDPRIVGTAGQLLGGPAVLFKEKINFKLPGSSGFAPHQDAQAGWRVYATRFVTAFVSLDAGDRANGCLEFAGRGDDALLGPLRAPLSREVVEALDFQPIVTAPGDAVFFSDLTPHRSAPNATMSPRRALYATYNAASDGDHYERYYADKLRSYPPEHLRPPGYRGRYRV